MGQQQLVRVSMLVAILVQFIPLKADGELQISGNETPLYVGLTKFITCTWTGLDNITELEWYLVGLEGLELGIKIDNNTIKLNPGRPPDISWNGRHYVCQATTTNGKIVKKYFNLWVKDLENKVTITPPCKDTFMAGESHILTCTVKSTFATNLTWVRIINGKEVEVVNTQNITIQAQTAFNNNSTQKSITFKSLHTSHAGKYKCVSVLNIDVPSLLRTKKLDCTVSIKIPSPSVELKYDSKPVISKTFALTAFIKLHPAVDTPTDIDSNWYGHFSLDDAPRVTISNTSGEHLSFNRSVQFTSLKPSDKGTYYFFARVRPLDSNYLLPSSFVNDSINISCLHSELQISGHETPAYVGLTKTITCNWTGLDHITKLEWYLVGLEQPLGRKIDNITTELITGRISNISLNGNLFVCKATTIGGRTVQKTIGLWVKEVTHKVTITPPCEDISMAGDRYTLTCTVNSDLAAKLKWVRIINGEEVEVVNTPNITVQAQTAFNNNSAEKSITFKPLATSHAGKYKCVSVLNITGPKILSTKELECAVSIKNATSLSILTLTPTSTPTAKASFQLLGIYVIVGVVATVIILISICVTSLIIVIKSRYWKNFHMYMKSILPQKNRLFPTEASQNKGGKTKFSLPSGTCKSK